MSFVPYVIEKVNGGERSYDIYSRLLKDRIVVMNGEVTDQMAASITAQLLFLSAEDPKKDITLYITSPGGSVMAGMAIYDTIQYIPNDVVTVCMGYAASMGAFILSGGAKGKRMILPNAEVMIHQPLGGAKGQATDIQIAAERILKTKEKLTQIIADNCGRTYEECLNDMERDNWMDSDTAIKYGIVDKIIDNSLCK